MVRVYGKNKDADISQEKNLVTYSTVALVYDPCLLKTIEKYYGAISLRFCINVKVIYNNRFC